jgi:hypothetical protein
MRRLKLNCNQAPRQQEFKLRPLALDAVPRLPPEHAKFQPFLDCMMHKIPEERPANCTAVWHNLEKLARD